MSTVEVKEDDDGFRPEGFVEKVRAGVLTLRLSWGSALTVAWVAVE